MGGEVKGKREGGVGGEIQLVFSPSTVVASPNRHHFSKSISRIPGTNYPTLDSTSTTSLQCQYEILSVSSSKSGLVSGHYLVWSVRSDQIDQSQI